MVVDLPQMPLQAYLPDHPLPMDSESASGLERSLPSSTLPESRETRPPETSSSPSALRQSVDALVNSALSAVLSNTPDADVPLQVLAGHAHTQENLPVPITTPVSGTKHYFAVTIGKVLVLLILAIIVANRILAIAN